MASVGSSDGSNRQDEVVRRNREDYRKNEGELIKKQKAELRRISEQHYQEIENLKNEHSKQMEAMHKQSSDTISERDFRYQKSMDELRDMHTKQLKKNAEETGRREEALRRSIQGDADSAKGQNDARFEKLSDDYHNNLLKAEETHQANAKSAREAQDQAIAGNRNKLERAFQKQNDAIRDERNEKVKQLEGQLNNYHDYAEGRFRDQEVREMQNKHKSSEDLMRAVGHERRVRTDNEQMLREGFDDGLNTQKNRYEKALNKERDALQMSANDFKSTVNGRVGNQVERLEKENYDLREEKTRDAMMLKRQSERQVANIREAYGKNIETAMDQRDEAVRASNEQSASDVAKVRDQLEKQMTNNGRFYRDRMEEQGRIHRNAYDNLVGSFESRQEVTKTNADQRVQQIYEMSEEEKQRLIQHQQDNHEASQAQMRDQVRQTRDQVDMEKDIAVRSMQDRMRKQEIQHAERMGQVVSKYEKQVQGLKDQVIKERRNGEENMKRAIDELQRAHRRSIDQLEAKNRDQVRQMTNLQSEELRSLNKRHEEKLDAVLAQVKKT